MIEFWNVVIVPVAGLIAGASLHSKERKQWRGNMIIEKRCDTP